MGEKRAAPDTEFSILDPYGQIPSKKETPAYFRDLNLDTVLDRLTGKWGSAVLAYYRGLPETAEEEAYRRDVYGDVKQAAVYGALTAFTDRMAGVEELRREKGRVPGILQQAVWQLREIEVYCGACAALAEALEKAPLSSEGMRRFREILRGILDNGAFRGMRDRVGAVMGQIRSLRLVVTYEKDRMRVALGEVPAEYAVLPDGEGSALKNPFAADPAVTKLENACLEILNRKKPDFFRELQAAAERYGTYEPPVLARFGKEILFYLSYALLQREMERKGFSFAVPTVSEERQPEAKGLYDLALACVFSEKGKPVVANDFCYREGERFFVLTGPNQGGKTTFARSLGQLVYFARLGLDVPAAEANVPFFREIQTHFSVEESVETGRGKLKEELVRLAPMMEDRRRGTFVVINELFTTAASCDALIMGRRVLEHFIGLGCMGIYVTHLKELAGELPQTVALQAMLDERRVPTFEIRRGEPPDVPCAENQVNKYRLSYAQLKERL